MADVIVLRDRTPRTPRRPRAEPGDAKVLLFTGVRYEIRGIAFDSPDSNGSKHAKKN
jgi:hypothetical protein